ncbi:MAG TPA: HlyD family secretion protein [Pyrinomonadaceae bacterium]|jgi:membrane fusion protein (multidrug efflux system)|nr:HlyD family secretion protein [Pyrinomonadaceae bacterium]
MTESESVTGGPQSDTNPGPESQSASVTSTVEVDHDPDAAITTVNGKNRKKKFIVIGAGGFLILALLGIAYWLYARQYESTDDAFIDGDITQIAPKVAAYVQKVDVNGNQFVHKGDLLVELNPADYQLKLEQAKAQLENAKAQYQASLANVSLTKATTSAAQQAARSNVQTTASNVDSSRLGAAAKQSQVTQAQRAVRTAQATLAQTRSQVPKVESDVHLAQVEYDRRLALFNHGDISRQSLDQAQNALQAALANLNNVNRQVDAAQSRVDEALANVATAQENYRQSLAEINVSRSQVDESQGRLADANAAPERITVSESSTETAQAQIAAAEAAVHQAEQDLTYTKIYAPEDGFVTRKTVEEGQLVQIGTPLMAISQSDEIWVVANFKETQLENMQIGQGVEIKVDAYPSRSFRGHVESFQVGTGSRFSLLPAENATGNFVKVVQRIPVKIVFDEQPENVRLLAPGMSVEPTVKVR